MARRAEALAPNPEAKNSRDRLKLVQRVEDAEVIGTPETAEQAQAASLRVEERAEKLARAEEERLAHIDIEALGRAQKEGVQLDEHDLTHVREQARALEDEPKKLKKGLFSRARKALGGLFERKTKPRTLDAEYDALRERQAANDNGSELSAQEIAAQARADFEELQKKETNYFKPRTKRSDANIDAGEKLTSALSSKDRAVFDAIVSIAAGNPDPKQARAEITQHLANIGEAVSPTLAAFMRQDLSTKGSRYKSLAELIPGGIDMLKARIEPQRYEELLDLLRDYELVRGDSSHERLQKELIDSINNEMADLDINADELSILRDEAVRKKSTLQIHKADSHIEPHTLVLNKSELTNLRRNKKSDALISLKTQPNIFEKAAATSFSAPAFDVEAYKKSAEAENNIDAKLSDNDRHDVIYLSQNNEDDEATRAFITSQIPISPELKQFLESVGWPAKPIPDRFIKLIIEEDGISEAEHIQRTMNNDQARGAKIRQEARAALNAKKLAESEEKRAATFDTIKQKEEATGDTPKPYTWPGSEPQTQANGAFDIEAYKKSAEALQTDEEAEGEDGQEADATTPQTSGIRARYIGGSVIRGVKQKERANASLEADGQKNEPGKETKKLMDAHYLIREYARLSAELKNAKSKKEIGALQEELKYTRDELAQVLNSLNIRPNQEAFHAIQREALKDTPYALAPEAGANDRFSGLVADKAALAAEKVLEMGSDSWVALSTAEQKQLYKIFTLEDKDDRSQALAKLLQEASAPNTTVSPEMITHLQALKLLKKGSHKIAADALSALDTIDVSDFNKVIEMEADEPSEAEEIENQMLRDQGKGRKIREAAADRARDLAELTQIEKDRVTEEKRQANINRLATGFNVQRFNEQLRAEEEGVDVDLSEINKISHTTDRAQELAEFKKIEADRVAEEKRQANIDRLATGFNVQKFDEQQQAEEEGVDVDISDLHKPHTQKQELAKGPNLAAFEADERERASKAEADEAEGKSMAAATTLIKKLLNKKPVTLKDIQRGLAEMTVPKVKNAFLAEALPMFAKNKPNEAKLLLEEISDKKILKATTKKLDDLKVMKPGEDSMSVEADDVIARTLKVKPGTYVGPDMLNDNRDAIMAAAYKNQDQKISIAAARAKKEKQAEIYRAYSQAEDLYNSGKITTIAELRKTLATIADADEQDRLLFKIALDKNLSTKIRTKLGATLSRRKIITLVHDKRVALQLAARVEQAFPGELTKNTSIPSEGTKIDLMPAKEKTKANSPFALRKNVVAPTPHNSSANPIKKGLEVADDKTIQTNGDLYRRFTDAQKMANEFDSGQPSLLDEDEFEEKVDDNDIEPETVADDDILQNDDISRAA